MTNTAPSAPTTAAPKLLAQHELATFADRVENTLAASKAELGGLNQALVHRFQEAFQALTPATRQAIVQGGPVNEIRAAYMLGQLGFAQTLVSQAFIARADDDFIDHVRSSTFGPMVRVLFEGELSNQELSAQLAESAEGISRKLRVLREKGVTDFRKNGRNVLNFLTPAGRQAAESVQKTEPSRS